MRPNDIAVFLFFVLGGAIVLVALNNPAITGTLFAENAREPVFSLQATPVSACGTISSSGQYVLNTSVSAAATCITITASSVEFGCDGFTITFDTGGTGGDGIIASTRTNLTVRNCIIVDGNAAGATGLGIDFTSVNHSVIANNSIQTNGTNDNYGIRLLTSSKNNTVANNTVRTQGTGANNFGINIINSAAGNNNSDNNLTNNTIITNGSSSNNYGINLQNNVHDTIIANNTIVTNGTVVNYGIILIDTLAGNSINRTVITGNNIQTNGSSNSNEGIRLETRIFHTYIAENIIETGVRSPVAGNSHYGIHFRLGSGNTTIVNNFIGTRGASDGIFSDGNAAPNKNENISIINNTIDTGGASADGIDLSVNTVVVLIENNTIMTGNASRRAGVAHGGIGITGITASLSNVTIFNNSITTNGSGAGNTGVTLNNFENATVANNTISTFGTNDNYGISFAAGGMINATVENNTIFASGTSIQNQGIRTAGGNFNQDIIIRYNNITTNGTSGNTGIFLNNIRRANVASNTIRTNGTSTGNIGIAFDSNAQNSTIANNTIDTNGTGSNHGISTLPAVGSSTFGMFIENNTIRARAAGANTIGLQVVNTNSVNNTARNNNVSVNGTTGVIGIQLTGTTINNTNLVENNTVFVNVTGASSRGIYVATTAATANHNISNNNVLIFSTSTDVRGFAIETVTSVHNYTGNTLLVERGTGALFYLVGTSNQQFNSTIVNMTSGINMIWIDAVLNNRNNLTNTTFANSNGSNRFPDRIEYNATATDFTQTFMNITFNRSFLNSSTFSAFNTTAQINLLDLPFTNPDPVVDFENDGTFAACSPSICTEVSFSGGDFVFNVTQWTSYAANEGPAVLDLVMSKDTINCNAGAFQDLDSVVFYTCGDKASVNGFIDCDNDGTASSSTLPTNATTCDVGAPNYGAFFLTNNGTVNATLNATLTNFTIGGVNATNASIDNYIFSAVSSPGCSGSSCNNCPAADTVGCFKDLDPSSSTPDSVQECDNFVANSSLCQCFSIHITDPSLVHFLRAGQQISFTVKKSLVEPAQSPCT